MLLRVQYLDSGYDYVDSRALSRLIVSNGIKKFHRPCENAWVDVDKGPTREKTVKMTEQYLGPERRKYLQSAS